MRGLNLLCLVLEAARRIDGVKEAYSATSHCVTIDIVEATDIKAVRQHSDEVRSYNEGRRINRDIE